MKYELETPCCFQLCSNDIKIKNSSGSEIGAINDVLEDSSHSNCCGCVKKRRTIVKFPVEMAPLDKKILTTTAMWFTTAIFRKGGYKGVVSI